ncbi:uncharacterized protein LOC129001965 [Macrosteles quadrilineatus]|uniref:uncharacterized protein LOC129001965 n=1 Tax=Macrosteles quadrilineatus TaxID=74068 RepID=UPI0023E2F7FF|nr:uncharacterized protein LOC129001965 [Macrosteles quadrilineatus]
MYNTSVTISMGLRTYQNGSFYMSTFDVDFSPKEIKVSLEHLLGGGSLGATVQDFLQDAAQQILARSRPQIKEDLRRTVISAANPRLVVLNGVSDLVSFFVKFSNVPANTC